MKNEDFCKRLQGIKEVKESLVSLERFQEALLEICCLKECKGIPVALNCLGWSLVSMAKGTSKSVLNVFPEWAEKVLWKRVWEIVEWRMALTKGQLGKIKSNWKSLFGGNRAKGNLSEFWKAFSDSCVEGLLLNASLKEAMRELCLEKGKKRDEFEFLEELALFANHPVVFQMWGLAKLEREVFGKSEICKALIKGILAIFERIVGETKETKQKRSSGKKVEIPKKLRGFGFGHI